MTLLVVARHLPLPLVFFYRSQENCSGLAYTIAVCILMLIAPPPLPQKLVEYMARKMGNLGLEFPEQ